MQNNDLISRSALEAKAKTIYMEFDNVAVPTRVISIADLHLAPTVDAVPMDFHESCLAREVHRRFEAEQKLKDAEPVRLRIDTVEVDAEKGWYRKLHYCPCGQLIRTETWDKKYCFGQGTVLKGNVMPKHCPNCGAKMDAEEGSDVGKED